MYGDIVDFSGNGGEGVVEVMLVLGWKGVVGDGSDGVVVMGKGVMAG